MANSVKNSAGFEPLLKSLYYSFIRFSAICSTRSNLDNFLSEILYGLRLRKIFGKTTSLKALRLAFKGLFSCYLQRSFPFKNLVWSATDHFPDLSTPQHGKLFWLQLFYAIFFLFLSLKLILAFWVTNSFGISWLNMQLVILIWITKDSLP